jgi:acyl-CoA synthetase (NDP forming)/GNAT superfamily N-acetyltransferase
VTVPQTDNHGVDAVRADGGLVHIRVVTPGDARGVRALHARASDQSIYLRFFSVSRTTAESYVPLLTKPSGCNHHALAACLHGEIVGVASFERLDHDTAEIALIVADDCQHEGIGMLLLEHLASVARHLGLRRFVAEVLTENRSMAGLLRDIGFVTHTVVDRETTHVVLDLDPAERLITSIGERDRAADSASLNSLLAPRSIAIIGASDRVRSVGHQVLRNILEGGFTGTVEVVSPHHASILGVATVPSPDKLPVAPDLVIVAVPAEHVPAVVRACGERGARAVLLLSAGFGEAGQQGKALQDEVLDIVRGYGMRLVGPNCVGLVNTDPGVRLNATFAALPMQPGGFGMLAQSGAFGIAFLVAAARAGLGVSQFVSVGNKADVSGNDLMLRWERDPSTRVIGMYLESLGDPQRFARIARRVSRGTPILAIKSGRTAVGQRAGLSHTAAAASSDAAIEAVFRSGGVLRMSTMQDMLDAGRVLSEQPLPAGSRVAIVGNSGGPEILAADSAVAAGLTVVDLRPTTQALLRSAVISAASTDNPVDLGAAVAPEQVEDALHVLLAAEEVDAVLTVFTEVAMSDAAQIRSAVLRAAARRSKVVVATEVGRPPDSIPIDGTEWSLPVFTFPEQAAAALGIAHRYALSRAELAAPPTRPAGIQTAAARAVITAALASGHDWLEPAEVTQLLALYGMPACPQRVVDTVDGAVRAAAELGYPVAVKLASGGVHKTEIGGLRLNLGDEADVRRAFCEITAASGSSSAVLVQPMVVGGTEVIVGVVRDPQFGPLIMLGAGGVLVDLLDDRTFRLAPLSAVDADVMVGELRLARLLDGYRGAPAVSRPALCDVLVRVAALAADLPEIAELDLNPLVCTHEGLVAVDARIRVSIAPIFRDPLLRQLRGPTATTTEKQADS